MPTKNISYENLADYKEQYDALLEDKLAEKEDVISDLSTIRSGAAAGATAYQKPVTGIPSSDIAEGVIPDVSSFITKSVNDLVNYYTKTETYTQTEVNNLIGAINQFRYEIAASTSAVQSPQSNVLYLIGPTGSGADKYEEYVYTNSTWTKIGDASIDLSGYVTTSALSTALADYTTTTDLTTLLAGKADKATTLAGYGITDAKIASGVITLGSDTITPLTSHQDISGKADKSEMSVVDGTDANADKTTITLKSGTSATVLKSHQDISGKVDKVNGKGLSTEDYTTAEQTKLSGIETGAQVNVIETIKVNGSALTPSSKAVEITVPVEDVTLGGSSVVSNGTAVLPAYPTVPTISTDITTDATSDTKTTSPKAVKTFVEGKGYGTYSKPSGGIPSSDMSSDVQTSLGKADTALQSFAETDPVFSASAAAGIQSSDITAWNAKYDKPSGGIPSTDLASGVIPTVPTISTNIAADATSDTKTASPKAVKMYADSVSAQSSLFPNFDLAIPKQTIEFDVARTKEYLFCSIANTGLTYADLFDKVGFRITVTGTNKKQVVDVVAIWGGGDTTAFDIYTMTVGTGGIKNIYGGWPNTLNNGYPWYISAESPDSAQRHVKVEVFYDTPNVTWVNQLTDEPYDATYHSWGAIATTSSQIKSLRGIPINVNSANTASYAGMITSYLSTYMGGGTIYTAGTALTADNLIFQGTDGNGYPVSTTNVAIRTNVPIALCGTNASANGGLSFGNIREKGIVSFANTSATYGTFAQGDEVYLRCSMTNGAIYSDGVLANTMSAGYTWIEIGHAQSATTLSYNTSGKSFLTLDANGKLTHVNGQEIAMPSVAMAVSTSTTLADNTYHKLSSAVGTQTFTLPTISDTTAVHNVIIAFTTSSSPNITFSSSATIMYASDFALEASTTYEVNCLWNGTVWVITAFAYESAS